MKIKIYKLPFKERVEIHFSKVPPAHIKKRVRDAGFKPQPGNPKLYFSENDPTKFQAAYLFEKALEKEFAKSSDQQEEKASPKKGSSDLSDREKQYQEIAEGFKAIGQHDTAKRVTRGLEREPDENEKTQIEQLKAELDDATRLFKFLSGEKISPARFVPLDLQGLTKRIKPNKPDKTIFADDSLVSDFLQRHNTLWSRFAKAGISPAWFSRDKLVFTLWHDIKDALDDCFFTLKRVETESMKIAREWANADEKKLRSETAHYLTQQKRYDELFREFQEFLDYRNGFRAELPAVISRQEKIDQEIKLLAEGYEQAGSPGRAKYLLTKVGIFRLNSIKSELETERNHLDQMMQAKRVQTGQVLPKVAFVPWTKEDLIDAIQAGRRVNSAEHVPEELMERHLMIINDSLQILAENGIRFTELSYPEFNGTPWKKLWRVVYNPTGLFDLGNEKRLVKQGAKHASEKRYQRMLSEMEQLTDRAEAHLQEFSDSMTIEQSQDGSDDQPADLDNDLKTDQSSEEESRIETEINSETDQNTKDDQDSDTSDSNSGRLSHQREELSKRFEDLQDYATAEIVRNETFESQEGESEAINTWNELLVELESIKSIQEGSVLQPYEYQPLLADEVKALIDAEGPLSASEHLDQYILDRFLENLNKAYFVFAAGGVKPELLTLVELQDSQWTELWNLISSFKKLHKLGRLLAQDKNRKPSLQTRQKVFGEIHAIEQSLFEDWSEFNSVAKSLGEHISKPAKRSIFDPLALPSTVYSKDSAGKRFEAVNVPFPKSLHLEATIQLVRATEGSWSSYMRYKFSGGGSHRGHGGLPNIAGATHDSRKGALQEEFHSLALSLLARDGFWDRGIKDSPSQEKKDRSIEKALKAFARENDLLWIEVEDLVRLKRPGMRTQSFKGFWTSGSFFSIAGSEKIAWSNTKNLEHSLLSGFGFHFVNGFPILENIDAATESLGDLQIDSLKIITAALFPRKTWMVAQSLLYRTILEWGVETGIIDSDALNVEELFSLPFWKPNGRSVSTEIWIDQSPNGKPLIDFQDLSNRFRSEVLRPQGYDSIRMLFEECPDEDRHYQWFMFDLSAGKPRRVENVSLKASKKELQKSESVPKQQQFELDPKQGPVENYFDFIKANPNSLSLEELAGFPAFADFSQYNYPDLDFFEILTNWHQVIWYLQIGREQEDKNTEDFFRTKYLIAPDLKPSLDSMFFVWNLSQTKKSPSSWSKDMFEAWTKEFGEGIDPTVLDQAWADFEENKKFYNELIKIPKSDLVPLMVTHLIRQEKALRSARFKKGEHLDDRFFIGELIFNRKELVRVIGERLSEIPWPVLATYYDIITTEQDLVRKFEPFEFDGQSSFAKAFAGQLAEEFTEPSKDKLLLYLFKLIYEGKTGPQRPSLRKGENTFPPYIDQIIATLHDTYIEGVRPFKKLIRGLKEIFNVPTMGAVWEAAELSWALWYRSIYHEDSPFDRRLDQMIRFWNQIQPTYDYSDTTKELYKQYSTPCPISAIVSEYTGMKTAQSVFDPSAGNGLLLIGAVPESVHANEIDFSRFSSLRYQGFKTVTRFNAAKPIPKELEKSFDVVVTNPPFARWEDDQYDKKHIIRMYFNNQYNLAGNLRLEHMMAGLALKGLKDDGKAALLLMGHIDFYGEEDNFRIRKFRPFFNWLYRHYYVEDIINLNSFKMYNKQGAVERVMLVLINGRKPEPQGTAPTKLQAPHLDNIVSDFHELWHKRVKHLANPTLENAVKQLKIELEQ